MSNKNKLWTFLSEGIRKYREDAVFRTQLPLYVSLLVNVFYSLFEAACGLFYHSWWFGTQAFYYIIMGTERFLLAKSLWRGGMTKEEEYRKSRNGGILFLVLTIGLVGRSVLVTKVGFSASYKGWIIYGIAAYTFYCVITAAINLHRYRKFQSPVLSACRTLVFVNALVSLYSLQTALLSRFGNDEAYNIRMNAITGTAVCLITFITAVIVIVSANRKKSSK